MRLIRNALCVVELVAVAVLLAGCASGPSKDDIHRRSVTDYESLIDASGVANPAVSGKDNARPVVTVTLINGGDQDLRSVRLVVDLSYEGTNYHDAQVVQPLDDAESSRWGEDRNVLPKDGGRISFPVTFRQYRGPGEGEEDAKTHRAVVHVRVTDVGVK